MKRRQEPGPMTISWGWRYLFKWFPRHGGEIRAAHDAYREELARNGRVADDVMIIRPTWISVVDPAESIPFADREATRRRVRDCPMSQTSLIDRNHHRELALP